MLDGTAGSSPPAIVVGRTLSAYFVGDVQNNQETITYTVYNEQADDETGVLLTTTLERGVTFSSASQQPDQSGQNLAWSLGKINGFDRASVTLTVALTSPIPPQLDTGAQAFATLDGAAVSALTPAASLSTATPPDPSLLGSTPDANTTDPYVQEEAAELGYDPTQIFSFLHTQIDYNSYIGSLRGALGTLWAGAGNALDVASLGVALMRASGIPARYDQGTLSSDTVDQLILSMFPPPLMVVGCVDPGIQKSDPTDDPQLIAEAADHYWFEFDTGNGFTPADPIIPTAAIGQSFTTSESTFTEVPDSLRQKVEIQIKAELTIPAAGLLTGGTSQVVTTVLDQTFNDVDLVGVPISVGNFVDSQSISAQFAATTNTYTPYLRLNDGGDNSSNDQIITGTPYQEVLTNFPFGTEILTGLFLDLILTSPGNATQTIEKTLFDRIGFAGRQDGNITLPPISPDSGPALSPLDTTTLDISAAAPTFAAISSEEDDLSSIGQNLNNAVSPSSGDQSETLQQLQTSALLTQAGFSRLTASLGDIYMYQSNQFATSFGNLLLTRSYFDSPQVVAVSSAFSFDGSANTSQVQLSFDVLRDTPRSIASPLQSEDARNVVQFVRGLGDSSIESTILDSAGGSTATTTSSYDVFLAAEQAGIGTIVVNSSNLPELDALNISAEAKDRITQSVQDGHSVLVPTSMVNVGEQSTIAWLDLDPTTESVIAVSENGEHFGGAIEQAVTEYYAKVLAGTLGTSAGASWPGRRRGESRSPPP